MRPIHRVRVENKQPVTLVVFGGQSNGKGWSTDPLTTTALTAGYGYELYPASTTSADDVVVMPLRQNIMGRTQGGPQSAFAQAWVTAGGAPCMCLDTAVNGCTMDTAAKSTATGSGINLGAGTFDLSDANNRYISWVRPLVSAALRRLQKSNFHVVDIIWVWAQGESDAGANNLTNQAAHTSKLTALFQQIKSDFNPRWIGISELGTPNTGTNAFYDAIRAAQAAVVAALPTYTSLAFTDAKNFSGAGKMVDTLHYTQTGYNEMGAGLANSIIASIGGRAIPKPTGQHFRRIARTFPYIKGFKRLELVVQATAGAWAHGGLFSDPTTPEAATLLDELGENLSTTTQAISWTFSRAGPTRLCLYVADSSGGSVNIVGASTSAISLLRPIDPAIRINSFNFGTTGSFNSAMSMAPDEWTWAFDPTVLTTLGLGPSNGSKLFLTSQMLGTYPLLTTIRLASALPPPTTVNLSANPLLTTLVYTNSSLSVEQINTFLTSLDANGLSNGTCTLTQSPAVPPTGAGLTAKANLQARGWTVTTD